MKKVAHHEPIWNSDTSVSKVHRSCYELIQSISNDAITMLEMIDRFPKIYKLITKPS